MGLESQRVRKKEPPLRVGETSPLDQGQEGSLGMGQEPWLAVGGKPSLFGVYVGILNSIPYQDYDKSAHKDTHCSYHYNEPTGWV